MRQLRITVKGPEVEISAEGYSGSSCAEATRRMLGSLAPERLNHTADYYRTETATMDQVIQQEGG